METLHHHLKTWKDGWSAVRDGEGGGQGDVKIVVRRENADGAEFFLKILRQQNDPARRSRMFREVAAYRTLKHEGIPRLVDSNVDKYDDSEYKLFLVSEYIPGLTIHDYIASNGTLTPSTAVDLVCRILEIIEYCHSEEIIHRDIKPANVILRDSSLASPVLVDFGLSFNRADEDIQATATAEEVGNRFLRLPELAPMSPAKREPRSDVCFACGLLLFCISGETPVQLVNERHQMPHQRDGVRARLDKSVEPTLTRTLLPIFDRGFQLDPALRWQTARDLRLALRDIALPDREPKEAREILWKRIEGYTKGPDAQGIAHRAAQLSRALDRVQAVQRTVSQRLGNHFSHSQTGHLVDGRQGVARTQLAFIENGVDHRVHDWIAFEWKIVGGDMLATASFRQQTWQLYRTSLDSPSFNASFDSAVEEVFLRQVESLLHAS